MWVEFVVVSRPCFKGFSLGSPVFLPPQKSTFPNFNSSRDTRRHKLQVLYISMDFLNKGNYFVNYTRNTTESHPLVGCYKKIARQEVLCLIVVFSEDTTWDNTEYVHVGMEELNNSQLSLMKDS